MAISPTQSNVLTALRTFLADPSVLGSIVDPDNIIMGQPNQVPEPQAEKFVVMTPGTMTRLSTNIDTPVDALFAGSIDNDQMTITSEAVGYTGQIEVGSFIFGVGVAPGTRVTDMGTGTGAAGVYTVVPAGQTVASGTVLAAGTLEIKQPTHVVVQVAFHDASPEAGDLAAIVTTLFRDQFGVQLFRDQAPNYGVGPLYADEARQAPFLNGEQQIEFRWAVDVHLQANFVVTTPQQFFEVCGIEVLSVEALFPAT